MKYFFLLFLLAMLPETLHAQYFLDEFATYKVKPDHILLRWEPKTYDDWNTSITKGYFIDIYQKSNSGNKLVEHKNIKPGSDKDWLDQKKSITDTLLLNFYEGVHSMMHPDADYYATMKEILADSKTTAAADSFRLGMILYSGNFDFNISRLSGLGYRFNYKKGEKYQVYIYTETSGASDTISVEINTETVIHPVPELSGDFGNKKVKLGWDTKKHKKYYFGYYIEQGKTDKKFNRIDPMPYVSGMGGNNDTLNTYISQEIKLDSNYRTYWFRIVGMDYFGEASVIKSTIKGYGFDELDISPTIAKAEQTEDNKAYLEWTYPEKYTRLVKHIRILRADSIAGNYVVVADKIPVKIKKYTLNIDSIKNYYRIELVPKDGKPVSSFPVFIIGQDTVAPVTPINFEGKIDTQGIVQLKWIANREQDLWGYRIFKANFKDDEFVAMNVVTKDSFFVDTLSLNTALEEIYYKIIAIDERNNRSPQSPILVVRKPDIVPPYPGKILSSIFNADRVEISYQKSISKDVIAHRLYRKNIQKENTWTLIAELDTTVTDLTFLDKGILPDSKYAYIITAIDDAGLESKPGPLRVVETKKIGYRKAFEQTLYSIDAQKQKGKIEWTFLPSEEIKEVIIYKGREEKKISVYKIIDGETRYLEERVRSGDKFFYYLCPVFKDDTYGKFSELLILENKKTE